LLIYVETHFVYLYETTTVKPAEPFGDASKRHARLTLLQRTVEIVCTGVTNGGVITGDMFVGQGGQRRNYSLELVGAGLATLDQRKIEYGEVPKMLMDAMDAAQKNRVGIWSVEQKTDEVTPFVSRFVAKILDSAILTHVASNHHCPRKRLCRRRRNPRRRYTRSL